MTQLVIEQKDYEELVEDSIMLECLKAAGVDNWGGYDDAMREYRRIINEDQ